jgi:hypothetical protein
MLALYETDYVDALEAAVTRLEKIAGDAILLIPDAKAEESQQLVDAAGQVRVDLERFER